jgi:hypothetical protein
VNRKIKVPENISTEWRSFGLPREVSIALWNHVHIDVPGRYPSLRVNRSHDDRSFRHRKVFKDASGEPYLFVILVDDSTSPDDLIVTELRCIRKH